MEVVSCQCGHIECGSSLSLYAWNTLTLLQVKCRVALSADLSNIKCINWAKDMHSAQFICCLTSLLLNCFIKVSVMLLSEPVHHFVHRLLSYVLIFLCNTMCLQLGVYIRICVGMIPDLQLCSQSVRWHNRPLPVPSSTAW